jgi:chromosome partitioning protein
VIPTRPSPHDLRAAGATVELADRSDKPFMFVIYAATPRARITSDAAIALSQHGTVSPTTIHQRTTTSTRRWLSFNNRYIKNLKSTF